MNNMIKTGIITLLFFISGCIPTFQNPVTGQGEKIFDSNLLGMWTLNKKEGSPYAFLLFLPGKDLSVSDLIYYEENETLIFKATSASINKKKYLNIRSSEMEDYFLIKYEYTGKDEISIVLSDREYVKKMIDEKKLPGTVASNDSMVKMDKVRVTASSEQLEEFLAKDEKEELFDPKNTQTFKFRDIGFVKQSEPGNPQSGG